jgi:hypothetical protein
VLLAPGEIIQRERILGRRHHAEIALDAGTQTHARFRRAGDDDRLDERMLHERLRDRGGLFRRDDEIEVAHQFLAAAVAAGDRHFERRIERAQIVAQRLRLGRDRPELKDAGMFRPLGDRLAELLLRRFAEARQLRDATRFASFFQLRDRADLQLLMQRFDLLRAEA